MEYAKLGRTGLEVSRLALGTANFGWTCGEDVAGGILDRCLDLGMNLIDTADTYGGGPREARSEAFIGRWLAADSSRRRRIVLATKVFHGDEAGSPNARGLSAFHIREACHASLRRLRTDHIDLYQMHEVDPGVPWEEVWQAMEQLVREGKVLYVGASNFAGWTIAQSQAVAAARHLLGLVSHQAEYHLAMRRAEVEVLPACDALGTAFLAWSPLGGGLLAGKALGSDDGRRAEDRVTRGRNALASRLRAYEALCSETGSDPAEVALAWLLSRRAVTSLLLGPRSIAQLDSCRRALDLRVPGEVFARLEALWAGPDHALETPDAAPSSQAEVAGVALDRSWVKGRLLAAERAPARRDPSASPVSFWAITTGRSGTTTLARLLAHTPGVDVVHEPHPSLFVEGRRAIDGDPMPLAYASRMLVATRGWLVEGSGRRGHVPFEASPLLGHLAEPIRHAFGDARFVHLVRRPHDFVRSALGGDWCTDGPMDAAWPRGPQPSWQPWQRVIWFWAEVHRKGLELEARWGPRVVRRVMMEDLVSSPAGFASLLAWMGLEAQYLDWLDGPEWACVVESRNPSPRRARWEPEWDVFLNEVAGDVLRELGVPGKDSIPRDPSTTAGAPKASPPVSDDAQRALTESFCALLGLDRGATFEGATVLRIEPGEVVMRVEAEPSPPFRLLVAPRGHGRHFARSARFELSYWSDEVRRVTNQEMRVLGILAAKLRARDPDGPAPPPGPPRS